jgi:hypothetical protein
MSRRLGVVCAAALLAAAAGCTVDSFLASFTGPNGQQEVVAGSVDQVSANLQAALGRVGVQATATHQGQDVRLSGVTHSGRKFTLLLTRQNAGGAEKTVIAVQWEADADEQFWLMVLQMVMASSAG